VTVANKSFENVAMLNDCERSWLIKIAFSKK
jgi:hypothetical protein